MNDTFKFNQNFRSSKMKNTILGIAVILIINISSTVSASGNDVKLNQTNVSNVSDSSYFRKDPSTGKVKQPDSKYYQDIQDLNLNQSDENLDIEVLADGSERVNLQGRFMMHSAILNKDGKVEHICTNHVASIHKMKPTIKRSVK